jgi:hypothetical protein
VLGSQPSVVHASPSSQTRGAPTQLPERHIATVQGSGAVQSALVRHCGTVVVVVDVAGLSPAQVSAHVAAALSTHVESQDVSQQYGSRRQTSTEQSLHWRARARPSTHSS